MRKANEVPELKESGEIGRKELLIALVEQQFTPLLCREGVINIDVEELDKILYDSNPDDQGHEGMPNALRSMPPKDIASIHIVLGVNGDDLLDLPEWMH